MALPAIFSPALSQIEAKWPSLSPEQVAKLTANLPDLQERLQFFEWNARLSTMDRRFLEPCQAVYAALQAWEGLSLQERVTVTMAGIEPVTKAAAALGLIGGIPAGTVR